MRQPIEKLLANGYCFSQPETIAAKTEERSMQEAKPTPAITDADAGAPDAAMKLVGGQVSPAANSATSSSTDTNNGEAADDPAAILMQQWEAERNKVDEEFP